MFIHVGANDLVASTIIKTKLLWPTKNDVHTGNYS